MNRKMKNSGIEWIGEIPEDWEVRKLGNISALYTGNSIKDNEKDNYAYPDNAIPYLGTKDVNTNNAINYDNGMYVKKDDLSFKRGYSNSTLICVEGGSAGRKIANLEQEVAFGNKLCCINSKVTLNKYIYYYVLSPSFNSGFNARVTGLIPGVTLSDLGQIEIVIPLPEEQQRIANFLDQKVAEIDHILDKTKESIEEYKRYKQSLITEAVTKGLNPDAGMKDSGVEWIGEVPEHWDVTRPNRVCNIIRGNSAFQKDDMRDEGDFVAVQYGQIYKIDEVDETFKYYIDKSFYKANQLVQKDDTILVSTSETMEDLGHSCFYDRHDYGLLGGEQMCLRPNESNILGKFLYYATTYFKYELNQYATGLKVFRFKLDDLKKISIVIPPIDEQTKIVNFLDKRIPIIGDLISSKEHLLSELESYKKSLIYECVTGKREIQ